MNIHDRLAQEHGRAKKTFLDGTHRTRPPGETVRDYGRKMPELGITRLSNITGLDYIGLPTWQAIRPNSRMLACSQGKGATHDAAKASALMESIECWHAEHVDLTLRFDSFARMRRRYNTIDAERVRWLPGAKFRADEMRGWIEGWDLMEERPIWLPAAHVITTGTAPRDETFISDTNGLSSGNTFGEAIVHGLCEVIERDAQALWVVNADDPDGKVSQIDLDTITDENSKQLVRACREGGLVIGAYEITSDIGIPAYTAILSDRPGSFWSLVQHGGYGCHLDPAVALSRALTEAAQSRLTTISGARDDMFEGMYQKSPDEVLREIERAVSEPPPTRRFDPTSLATGTPTDDLRLLLERLKARGITNVAVVDLSQESIGIPAVKVVVTDMEEADSALMARRRAMIERAAAV